MPGNNPQYPTGNARMSNVPYYIQDIQRQLDRLEKKLDKLIELQEKKDAIQKPNT